MKLLLLTTPIFATNFESYGGQRAVDTIQCPGRCWEFDGTMCVPEADKVNEISKRNSKFMLKIFSFLTVSYLKILKFYFEF